MDVERIIDDIEQLQEKRSAEYKTTQPSDICAANRRHDEVLAHSRGFGFGSGMDCVAEPDPRHSGWAKLRADA